MMKCFVCIIVCILSLPVLADYSCDLSLNKSSDTKNNSTSKTIKASSDFMGAYDVNNFSLEKSLTLRVFMSGWPGEEGASFTLMKENHHSEKINLSGNDKDTLWFDDYRLDIQCLYLKS